MVEGIVKNLWCEARELSLGAFGEVERLDSPPSPLRFLRDYVSANKPCVISRSATRHWPAVANSLWSDDDYLCRALLGQAISVHLTPHGRADSLVPHPGGGGGLCFASACILKMELTEALRMIASSGSPSSSVIAYGQQQNDCFRTEYSPLAGDVEAHIPWASEAFGCLPEAVNLWIGSERSETSFHKDHYENLYAVVTGEKHFLLLPPTDLHRLYIRQYPAANYTIKKFQERAKLLSYEETRELELELELEEPHRMVPWSSVDPYPPSADVMKQQISSFPLYFQGPKPFQCTLKAGDLLYLPSMWFHHVRQTPDSSGRTIAINYWYDMQFDIKYAYFNFLQSISYPLLASDCSEATGADQSGKVNGDLPEVGFPSTQQQTHFVDTQIKEKNLKRKSDKFIN